MDPEIHISLAYNLILNPCASFRDDGTGTFSGMDEAVFRGPKESIVDRMDWPMTVVDSIEEVGRIDSVRLQIVYIYRRIIVTLVELLGEDGFAHLMDKGFGRYEDISWFSDCIVTLDRLANILVGYMSSARRCAFVQQYNRIASSGEDPDLIRIRESFRLIIRFERLMQVDRYNTIIEKMSPDVYVRRGDVILGWFRSMVRSDALSTVHTSRLISMAMEHCSVDELGSGIDNNNNNTFPTTTTTTTTTATPTNGGWVAALETVVRSAVVRLVCDFPLFTSCFPETFRWDRKRLHTCHKVYRSMVMAMATADSARNWACGELDTYAAVGFINELDAILVPESDKDNAFNARVVALIASAMRSSGKLGIGESDDDINRRCQLVVDSFHMDRGHTFYRSLLERALLNSSESDDFDDRWFLENVPSAPTFLPCFRNWCLAVRQISKTNYQVFEPLYQDLVSEINDSRRHGRRVANLPPILTWLYQCVSVWLLWIGVVSIKKK
jgi:hypothetical protein